MHKHGHSCQYQQAVSLLLYNLSKSAFSNSNSLTFAASIACPLLFDGTFHCWGPRVYVMSSDMTLDLNSRTEWTKLGQHVCRPPPLPDLQLQFEKFASLVCCISLIYASYFCSFIEALTLAFTRNMVMSTILILGLEISSWRMLPGIVSVLFVCAYVLGIFSYQALLTIYWSNDHLLCTQWK